MPPIARSAARPRRKSGPFLGERLLVDHVLSLLSLPQKGVVRALGTNNNELSAAIGIMADTGQRTLRSPTDAIVYELKHGPGSLNRAYDPSSDPDKWKYDLLGRTSTDPLVWLGFAASVRAASAASRGVGGLKLNLSPELQARLEAAAAFRAHMQEVYGKYPLPPSGG